MAPRLRRPDGMLPELSADGADVALPQAARRWIPLLPPKSAKSRRTIVLPGPLVAALAVHRRRELAEHLEWKQLLTKAGVRHVAVHVARHTAATLLSQQQGVPVRVVMDILGHAQLSQTLAIYLHTPPELALDAAERIARALWGQAA